MIGVDDDWDPGSFGSQAPQDPRLGRMSVYYMGPFRSDQFIQSLESDSISGFNTGLADHLRYL